MPQANVLLLVTGGIAAYKASYLTRLFVQAGFSVRVAMTDAAQHFVAPLTFQVLSGHPVATDLWGEGRTEAMDHIEWARWADLVVAAPATANLLAKAACGIADDMVTTLLLAWRGRLILAPAMNDAMWEHPATQTNLKTLQQRGAVICGPSAGDLACGTVAEGRMSEPEQILEVVRQQALAVSTGTIDAADSAAAAGRSPWSGRRVVVTAGPTWEPIDPVRYVSNRSTGVFGYTLASEAAARGADVTLISGPTGLATPPGVGRVLSVETSDQMAAALADVLRSGADWLFMAAAVADFRPAQIEAGKLKKETIGTAWNLEMNRTIDILGDVVAPDREDGPRVVGFALETDDLVERATEKMHAKGMDYIVANDLSAPDSAFGPGTHRIYLIGPEGIIWNSGFDTKASLARGLFDRLSA